MYLYYFINMNQGLNKLPCNFFIPNFIMDLLNKIKQFEKNNIR